MGLMSSMTVYAMRTTIAKTLPTLDVSVLTVSNWGSYMTSVSPATAGGGGQRRGKLTVPRSYFCHPEHATNLHDFQKYVVRRTRFE
jgi:hypothetical protein